MRFRMAFLRFTATVLAVAFVSGVAARDEAQTVDPELLNRLRLEAPQKWEEVFVRARKLQCSFTLKDVDKQDGSVAMDGVGEEKVCGSVFLQTGELLAPTKQWPGFSRLDHSYAQGINSKYEVELVKRVGGKEWTLQRVKRLSNPADAE